MKLCKDCRYYQRTDVRYLFDVEHVDERAECLHPKAEVREISPVSGVEKIRHQSCWSFRVSAMYENVTYKTFAGGSTIVGVEATACGPEGLFWEQRGT